MDSSGTNTIKIMHLTDIHLGCKIDPDKIEQYFATQVYPRIPEVQLIIVGGDFFHTVLNFNGPAGYVAMRIIRTLQALALNNEVFIRVNRGTFTHDKYQNRFFKSRYEDIMLHGQRFIEVYEAMDYEYIESLDLRMLYVPDDLVYEDRNAAIIDMITRHHVSQVDFLIHHGYFDHMLPSNIKHKPLCMTDYKKVEKYVKGAILNGHIHTFSIFKKLITTGSLTRFAHGEEEEKGFTIITYDKSTGHVDYEFVENENASKFVTFSFLEHTDVETAMADYSVWLAGQLIVCPVDDILYVRLIVADEVMKKAATEYTRSNFPNVKLSYKRIKVEEPPPEIATITELPIITPDNIASLIYQHAVRHGMDVSQKDVEGVLDECKVA